MPLYSHSRIQTFENCPQKYKFQYIDRIEKPEEETIEAFVGSRVHDALEKLYDDLQRCKLHSLEDLLTFYDGIWKKEWVPTIRIVKENFTAENYFDYGVKCIRNYYERYKPFDQAQTLETEARLVFPLDERGEYKIQGYVDRIARRADGVWEIHDYKTGSHLPPQAEIDSDRQLALYQIGLQNRWREATRVELVWHYVAYDTTLRSQRAPEDLKKLAAETIRVIEQIEEEKDFAPRESKLCNWCEYRAECPLWKHVDSVQLLSEAQFAADEGARLASQLLETKMQLDRLTRHFEELKALITEFCRQKKVSVVAGRGGRVTVKQFLQTAFPLKHDPRREPLEALLKQLGRWEDVSGLDVFELKRIFEEKLWPENQLSKVQPFATTETATRVTVMRNKAREEEA
ncbi:MAG: RecB family exonuclease [Terriglobia bacterium]